MFVKWNRSVYDRFNRIFDIKIYPLHVVSEYFNYHSSEYYIGPELDFQHGYCYNEEGGTICEAAPMKICYIFKLSEVVMQIPDELFEILKEPLERVYVNQPVYM